MFSGFAWNTLMLSKKGGKMKELESITLIKKGSIYKGDKTNYKDKVLEFLNHPWQEDREIEFCNLIDENSDKIMIASDFTIKLYLQRLYKENKDALMIWASDSFVDSLESLLN